jgi:hypothetical protein
MFLDNATQLPHPYGWVGDPKNGVRNGEDDAQGRMDRPAAPTAARSTAKAKDGSFPPFSIGKKPDRAERLVNGSAMTQFRSA